MNISILNRDREKYDNPKENISPLFYQNQIKNALRTEGGWADIDRDLKGNTVKSHITEDIIKMLTDQLEPNETYEQLKDSYLFASSFNMCAKVCDIETLSCSVISLKQVGQKDQPSLNKFFVAAIE